MKRITKQQVFDYFTKYLSSLDLGLDSHSAGIKVTNRTGSIDLSERMTSRRETMIFLQGLVAGLSLHQRTAAKTTTAGKD